MFACVRWSSLGVSQSAIMPAVPLLFLIYPDIYLNASNFFTFSWQTTPPEVSSRANSCIYCSWWLYVGRARGAPGERVSLVEELQQRFLPGVELGQVACHMVGIMCTHEGMSKLRRFNNHSRPTPLSLPVSVLEKKSGTSLLSWNRIRPLWKNWIFLN